eukprot:TRINITY_DN67694_c0_g1_i1.p1 TRINITY_DN67694_c0_g1~~TRINITY_DN67694_c0_g1_i1.p1  ORF type:complete len:139 (-),score=9.74 TRINITY_DN67694_c0_g1_i1:66-482(-)
MSIIHELPNNCKQNYQPMLTFEISIRYQAIQPASFFTVDSFVIAAAITSAALVYACVATPAFRDLNNFLLAATKNRAFGHLYWTDVTNPNYSHADHTLFLRLSMQHHTLYNVHSEHFRRRSNKKTIMTLKVNGTHRRQ